MTGDPGYLTDQPWWASSAAVRDALARRAAVAGRNLSIALLDAVGLAVLWLLVTYAYAWYGRGGIAYMLVPWWAFALGVVEATALWESFGRSLGQRFTRRELVRADGGKATFGRRMAYFLGWHLSVLPAVGVFFAPPWHERLSGLRLEQHEERGEAPRPWYRTSSGLFLATLFLTTAVAAVGGDDHRRRPPPPVHGCLAHGELLEGVLLAGHLDPC
ncbi:MAG: RDD family protein, partial [Candidatus Bipolaricaulota bacterium]